MKNPQFHNSQLQKTMKTSLPWFETWTTFKETVEQDIFQFEQTLIEWDIPIIAWVEVAKNGQLGWAPLKPNKPMRLIFRTYKTNRVQQLCDADLEVKVLAFPYLSELSYLICTKIKIAHMSHKELDQYGETMLGKPEDRKIATADPQKIARYV